jgi:hypothetical protein
VLVASLLLLACQAGTSGPGTGGTGGSAAGAGGSSSTGGGAGGSTGIGFDGGTGMEPDEEPFEADPPRPDAPPNPVNVRACGAIQRGAAAPVPVMGQEVFSMEAPAIASDEKLYRVSIPPRAGAASHVTFTAPTAGEYVLFVSAPVAVPVTVFAIDGDLVAVRLRLRIPECPEVNGRHSVQLQAAKYVVRLGPERLPSADVVVLPATGP